MVIVSWKTCCNDSKSGGVGMRSLITINEASYLVRCWSILNETETWGSIWTGVKTFLSNLLDNSVWNVGNGENIRFWTYNWCGEPLLSLLQIPKGPLQFSNVKLNNFIIGNNIVLPNYIVMLYPVLPWIIAEIHPSVLQKDMLMWNLNDNGHLSLKMLSFMSKVTFLILTEADLFGVPLFLHLILWSFRD